MTVAELTSQIIKQLGFTSWLGSPKAFVDLEPAQQIAVTDAVATYIRTHPTEFPVESLQQAKRYIGGNTLADTSLGASVGEFFGEVRSQASDINESVNPFSEKNRKWVLWVVLILAAVLIGTKFQVWRALKSKPTPKKAK